MLVRLQIFSDDLQITLVSGSSNQLDVETEEMIQLCKTDARSWRCVQT